MYNIVYSIDSILYSTNILLFSLKGELGGRFGFGDLSKE